MKKVIALIFLLILSSPVVFSEEAPSISFTSIKCDDFGVLSFKADYEWNSYNGGYANLQSVKVNAESGGVAEKLEGYWYKFKDKKFTISRINLNSPTAYFFSKPSSLKEGRYKITVDYVISRNNINYFKNKFTYSVGCPVQREIIKSVRKVEVVEKVVEEEKETSIPPVGEPPLIDKNTKSYVIYYMIGLWITIFIVSTILSKKFYKKRLKVRKKVGSEESVFEKE